MIPMRQLRSNPHFARLFVHVHPLFWPVLWWSLNRLFKWYDTSGYEEILFGTTRWGYVYVAWLGDKRPDPSAYRRYETRMARWDEPVWESNMPVTLLTAGAGHDLSRLVDAGGRMQPLHTEPAELSFRIDTS
jgi:hypothetical protein